MRKFLLTMTILFAAPLAAHAQTCASPPPQAVAAGYTTPVLTDNFTGNTISPNGQGIYNWYTAPGFNAYSESNGALTISSDNSGYGAGMGTQANANAALSTPGSIAANTGNGVVYRYGYFQATLSFNPNGYTGTGDWPSFWMGHAADGPSNPSGNFDEIDIFEGIPPWPPQAGVPANNTATLHEWAPGNVANTPRHAFNTTQNINFNQPNTYGVLWTPTRISIYLNNVLESSVAIGPGTPHPSAAIDFNSLILGTGYNWPVKFSSVDIWQSGQLPAAMQSGGQDAMATASACDSATAAPASAPTSSPQEQAAPAAPIPATTPPAAAAPTQTAPGNGSLIDCSGNVWTITSSGSIQENGAYTPGGGGSAALAISGCTVFGLDAHGKGWFTMSSVNASADWYWTTSAAPPGATQQVDAAPSTSAAAQPKADSGGLTNGSVYDSLLPPIRKGAA